MMQDNIPEVLLETKELYERLNLKLSEIKKDNESEEYCAYMYNLNEMTILFRKAKITPKKVGQFVTMWKRISSGPIQPYHISDNLDLIVINTKTENRSGQFVFSKTELCNRGVLRCDDKTGKLAMRVYPPWDKTTSKQAQKTQQWQLKYFLDLSINRQVDVNKAKSLYLIE